jgi:AraC-like DNA-binding protein
MSQDILSDVLRSVRLRSAVFYHVSGVGEWAAVAPPSRDIARAVMPDTDHLMEFHVVTRGECWATIAGQPPLRLRHGDIIVLPQGDAHVVSSTPGIKADVDVDSYLEMRRNQRPFRLHYAGGSVPQQSPDTAADGAATRLVCGFIGCDARPYNPLLATLPRLLHLPATATGRSEHFARLAAEESAERRPGADALLERLSEMMFVDAVRRYVDELPQTSIGWLAGLRDRHVGRALGLLHEHPAADWTVDELSRQVGLSRSALHERFIELIGQPPIQYLTQWRMQCAARLLRETQATVASVALDVGYDSEAAFARAFKRTVGLPPATWRRRQAEGADDPATARPPPDPA